MSKDVPHSVHFCIVQMIGWRSKNYPLRIVRVEWNEKVSRLDGTVGGSWLTEYCPGDYRVLAVFGHHHCAERVRRQLSQVRVVSNWRIFVTGLKARYDRCISLEETDAILRAMKIADDPDCLYTYQKDKESYTQWRKRQHP